MRFDKLTTKFQQALADAQSLAARNDHPYIEPVHVLSALLSDADSGAGSLLARAGVAVNRVGPALETALKSLPQVQGEDNVQVGRDLQGVLTRTDKEAARRGDTYIARASWIRSSAATMKSAAPSRSCSVARRTTPC